MFGLKFKKCEIYTHLKLWPPDLPSETQRQVDWNLNKMT